MDSRQRKTVLAIALVMAAAVIAAMLILIPGKGGASPESPPRPSSVSDAVQTPAPAQTQQKAQIIINELMEKNRAVVADGDGDFSDWIELRNISDKSVSLKGWRISDESGSAGWAFPDVQLDAGAYLLVFASGKDRTGPELHTDFSLSGDETAYLLTPSGSVADQAACGGCDADVSMALGADGLRTQSLYPTPAYENSADGYARFQETLKPAGPLVINETMVANSACFNAGSAGYCDWIEIKNISGAVVDLSDYYISDSLKDLQKCPLSGAALAPGQTLLLLCSDEETGFAGGYIYVPFSLDSGCEQLYLSDSSGNILDCASLRDIPYECSYGRMDGQNGWFYFAKPSPGADNSGGKRRVAAKPVNLTPDGVFDGVDGVSVELSGCGTVRYTLDGTAPTVSSPEYTGPFTVYTTSVVKAACFDDDALPSRTLALSYIINEDHTLPVVSLTSEDPAAFSQMYNGPAKGVELPANIALYRSGDTFSAGCGVSLNGETSLIMSKKNMSLRFRGTYGNATLKHDIFGGGVTEFTNLLLRAGQDQEQAIVRNELSQSLCGMAGADIVNQRSIFCVLYINGEYSGIYTLKEKSNKYLYASLAGVDPDSVEVIEAPAAYGSELYEQVIGYAYMNDMSLDENYRHICEQIDIDSLIDWLIMEGFCANTDVTSGNLRYCRSSEADGKWHFMFYDLDATFNTVGSMYYNLMSEYAEQHVQVSSLVRALMKNAEFRDRFLTRAAGLLRSTLTNETVMAELERMAGEIAPEVARDHERYGRTVEEWKWNLEYIRELVEDGNWRQCNIDAICDVFELSAGEREAYFGDIDGR